MDQMLQSIIQMAASGGNPMSLVQQFLGGQQNQNDPRAAQAMRMIQGKNATQLEETARNLAKQAGTTPEQILSNLGIPIPKSN